MATYTWTRSCSIVWCTPVHYILACMAHRQNKSLEEYIGRGLNLQRSIRSTNLLSAMNTDRPENQKIHATQRTTPWTWT